MSSSPVGSQVSHAVTWAAELRGASCLQGPEQDTNGAPDGEAAVCVRPRALIVGLLGCRAAGRDGGSRKAGKGRRLRLLTLGRVHTHSRHHWLQQWNCSPAPWALQPGRHLVTRAPAAGYLGLYVFYVVTVVLCTWIYRWQRRRSLVSSMPATPGEGVCWSPTGPSPHSHPTPAPAPFAAAWRLRGLGHCPSLLRAFSPHSAKSRLMLLPVLRKPPLPGLVHVY